MNNFVGNTSLVMALVANKSDLEPNREVDIEVLARTLSLPHNRRVLLFLLLKH